MKTCYTCKHYWMTMKPFENFCLRNAKEAEPSLITGIPESFEGYLDCYTERYEDGECGKEGKFWEPIK